jgi:signal transduction histidine kinase
LQTPLTSILGWSELALQRGVPDFTTRALEVVYRNAVRQKRLIDEILDMSRLVHYKMFLQPEATDLQQQADLAMDLVRQEAADRKLTLVMAPSTEPLPVIADPARLRQCIGNLLQNSLKFTPAGETVTVTCQRNGDRAELAVLKPPASCFS